MAIPIHPKGTHSACSTCRGHGNRTMHRFDSCSADIGSWDPYKILKKTQLPTFVLSPLSLTQNINVPIQPRCIVDDYFIALSSNRVLWSIFVLTTKHRPPLRALFDFGSPRFDFITHLELPLRLICMQ